MSIKNNNHNVFKQVKMKITEKEMAKFMYAIIITKSKLVSSLGVGIYNYTRKQNSRSSVDILISINERKISTFETLINSKLRELIIIKPARI